MNPTVTEKTDAQTAAPAEPIQLGWSSFFNAQLSREHSGLTPARITGVRKNMFLARTPDTEFKATLAGKFHNDPESCLPVVGDWVLVRDSVIVSTLSRKNTLSRGASGSRSRKHPEAHAGDQVLAANLDMVFIVCGLDRDFNPRRIERYLTLVYNCGIEPVIILTKADLRQHPERCLQEVESVAFGVSVYIFSSNDPETVSPLSGLIVEGRTAALLGSSGAGKSTLINRLYGEKIRQTGAVGTRLGKGRHTTTSRDLIVLPSGGMVIDNPGIREVALSVESQGAGSAFADIEELAQICRFSDCSHTHEPGCRVLEAVAAGAVSSGRLDNYLKLRREASWLSERESKTASRVEKERWKSIALKVKSIKKRN